MQFVLVCTDKPGSAELRRTTRDAHLAYAQAEGVRVLRGGPMLDAEGRPCGSVLLIEAADRAAADDFVARDPYGRAGLFSSVMIHPFRTVILDGARVDA